MTQSKKDVSSRQRPGSADPGSSPVLSLLLVWRPGEALPGLGWPRGIRVGRWGPEALVISILPGRARPGLSGALLSLGPALGGGGRGQGRPAAWCPESSGAALSVDGRHPDCLRPPWDGCVRPLGLQPWGQEGQGAWSPCQSRCRSCCGHVSCCPGAGLAGVGAVAGAGPLQTGQPTLAPSPCEVCGLLSFSAVSLPMPPC